MLKKDSLYVYLLSLSFLSKSFTLLSPPFSQNFGSPQDFPNFVKKVETNQKFFKNLESNQPPNICEKKQF